MTIKTQKTKITKPVDVFTIMKAVLLSGDIYDLDKEHFWVIGLNTRSTIKYIELCTLGTLDSTIVHPREVFRMAISQAVSSVILVHNHPSGESEPSEIDNTLTQRLVAAGKLLGIPVVDHVIIGDSTYYSYSDSRKM